MVAIYRFFLLRANFADSERPTSRFGLPVTTAVNLFSLPAFEKLSTKVKHSIGTWPTRWNLFSCLYSPIAWKLHHVRLYGNIIFRLFPTLTRIFKHECTRMFVEKLIIEHRKLYRQTSSYFPYLCSSKNKLVFYLFLSGN